MLAHERGHVAGGDLRYRLALELLLLFAAPGAAGVVRERWEAATERLRDSEAAERESPEAVASALLCMARAALQARSLFAAPFSAQAPSRLAARITSLLDGAPRGERAARRLGGALLLGVASLTALAAALAQPLHHALETVLG
jgi:beta-lactamase regulating signal transducer with metallopeptidase domain